MLSSHLHLEDCLLERAADTPTHVILTPDFAPRDDGGIAALMEAAAGGITTAGGRAVVIAPHASQAARSRDGQLGFEVERMRGRSWRRWGDVWLRLQLPGMLRQIRPQVVQVASWAWAAQPLALASELGFEVWLWTHAKELFGPDDPLRAEALTLCQRILATHGFGHRRLTELGVTPARLHRVTPAVSGAYAALMAEPAAFGRRHGLGGGPVLLTLARLIPRKGHDVIAWALPSLLRRWPRLVWVIAGEGPDGGRLRALVTKLGLAEAVRFIGFVPEHDKASCYAAADVYAMVNREEAGGDCEGFGLTFAEAAWQGVPSVCGRSGGVGDAVIDGETGLVVDDPRDVSQVAAALSRLLGDADLRATLGQAARARAREALSPIALGRRLLELAPGRVGGR